MLDAAFDAPFLQVLASASCVNGRVMQKPGGALTAIEGPHNGWVVGLEGRSTLSLCSERALNLAPARSRART